MGDKIKKSPNIRFAGFTDAWEQRKLGEFARFSKGQGYSKNDLTEEGTPIILYGRLYTKYQTLISDVDTFAIEKPKSIYSSGKEVIVPASGETAEDIARASAVAKSGVLLGGDLNIIYPNGNVDPSFLALSISNGEQQKSLAKKAQGKSVVHLRKTDLEELIFSYPSYKEQLRMSVLFLETDNLITLHQRKLELLKVTKKSMLQKMFPKDGDSVPEIRFEGFTDAWEQRKLGEISNSIEYGLNAAAKEFDGKNRYIRITDINDDSHNFVVEDVTSPDTDLSNADNYKLSVGDILFARTGASVGKSYIYKDSDGLVYYAGFLIRARIKEDYNPEFVFQNTLTKDYEKYITITSQRSGQPGVNAQEYSEYKIFVPKRPEQDKISSYLRNLDNIITLHQRELDSLKNLKKSMLQQMFI